jgi:hypothetical protein
LLLLVFSEVQSFRSPVASGLLFGIAPKSNQKGLAPDAVVRFASGNCSCVALPPASMPSRANRTALCFSALRGCADSTSMYCCASAAIHRRGPSGLIRNACDARHRERRAHPPNPCIPAFRRTGRSRHRRIWASCCSCFCGRMPPKRGPLWRGERAQGKARRVARRMRASSLWAHGCAVSEPPEHAREVGGQDARRPRHRGCVSLATFFAQAKKVARSPQASGNSAKRERRSRWIPAFAGMTSKDVLPPSREQNHPHPTLPLKGG